MNINPTYHHFNPCSQLSEFVHSFWMHANSSKEIETSTFAPDGFFKIIIIFQNNQIIRYFKTGIATQPKKIQLPPNTIGVGCRFKIIAPEYIFSKSFAYLKDQEEELDIDFLNVNFFDISNLDKLKEQWEKELLKIMPNIRRTHFFLLSLFKSIGDNMQLIFTL